MVALKDFDFENDVPFIRKGKEVMVEEPKEAHPSIFAQMKPSATPIERVMILPNLSLDLISLWWKGPHVLGNKMFPSYSIMSIISKWHSPSFLWLTGSM